MEPQEIRRWHEAARRSGEFFYAGSSNVLMTFISLTTISSHPHQLLQQQRTPHQVSQVHKRVLTANTFTDGPSLLQPPLHYGGSYLMNAVQVIQIQQPADTSNGPQDELQKYLKSGAESTTDIVGWWGVSLSYF